MLYEIKRFFVKVLWCLVMIEGRIFFKPICKDLGKDFIKDITKANGTVINDSHGFYFYFWY